MSREKEDPGAASATPQRPKSYSATDVRKGEIILRSRRRRMIFFGGLLAVVLVGLLLRFCALAA